MTKPFTKEGMQEVADDLRGTCQGLDDVLQRRVKGRLKAVPLNDVLGAVRPGKDRDGTDNEQDLA